MYKHGAISNDASRKCECDFIVYMCIPVRVYYFTCSKYIGTVPHLHFLPGTSNFLHVIHVSSLPSFGNYMYMEPFNIISL